MKTKSKKKYIKVLRVFYGGDVQLRGPVSDTVKDNGKKHTQKSEK